MLGAAFPLFTTDMYHNLGIHWASTIPAFLALVCVPFPFLFYKYGAKIRAKCKFAAEAAQVLAQLRAMQEGTPTEAEETASVLAPPEKEPEQVDTLAVNSDSDSYVSPPPPAATREGVAVPK